MNFKGKTTTYVLGFAVAMLWVVIIYRVVDWAKASDDSTPIIAPAYKKEAYDDYTAPKDTAKLLLNYRDPFGQSHKKDTVITGVNRPGIKSFTPIIPKATFNWNFIQYAGYIRNPDSKKLVTFVTINGKSATLSEGEIRDNVKLLKNLRDSIKISYNGKTKYITQKPAGQ